MIDLLTPLFCYMAFNVVHALHKIIIRPVMDEFQNGSNSLIDGIYPIANKGNPHVTKRIAHTLSQRSSDVVGILMVR